MLAPLEQWQDRLERHFESLADIHADSEFHIFALEHGLSSEQIKEIASLLCTHDLLRLPSPSHWLLWVIYATEHGYTYKGDEYWPPFEEQIPGWEFNQRYQLAAFFKKFQEKYNGVIPSGRWAKHFTIISWPVTHAILPKYLQYQFARTLYDLRYSLEAMETPTPVDIGRLLATNAHHASSSFQEFLQQEELTGRIVLALFGEVSAQGRGPIYQPTLNRIVSDLEEVRQAKEWLGETRSFVKDRFKGIGVGTESSRRSTAAQQGSTNETIYSVRPSIVLGHRGGDTWMVRLEVPSFQNVATISTEIQTFLRNTRCQLNGAGDFKPAGWLLSKNRKGVLKSWPNHAKPFIQFEQSHGKIDNLLAAECCPTSGPIWLFRVSSDGTAREITSHVVRPNNRYIVVTIDELPETHASISPCALDCDGVRGFRLQLLAAISAEDTRWLSQLGLQVARTILVWPAGFPGRAWDGEGYCEWLTTEAPCIGMMHDHPVDSYVLSLNQGREMVIEVDEAEQPVFIRVAPLPAGMHRLTIKAQRNTSLEEIAPTSAAEGFMWLHVREPEPWLPGVVSHPGLIVTLDPHDADLDTFARNKIDLSVSGPESHFVSLKVSLEDSNREIIFAPQSVANLMKLPITPDTWSNSFSMFLERHEGYVEKCFEAASGRLIIRGGELGECYFKFERSTFPLRWILRHDHNNIVVRLIDDTGQEESNPEILFFEMEHPLKSKRYSFEEALSGLNLKSVGGLFHAEQAGHSDTVMVSVPPKGLEGLRFTPDFSALHNGSIALSNCLRGYAYWYRARAHGLLVDIRWKQIVGGFLEAFYETLCGPNWAEAEACFRNEPGLQHTLDFLQGAMGRHSTNFAAALCRVSELLRENDDLTQASQQFFEVAAQHGVSADSKLCDFALSLAYEAHEIPTTCGGELDSKLNAIRSNPVLLRGARLLVLLSANPEQ